MRMMSYVELAKRSLARARGEPSPVEAALSGGARLTLAEIAERSGVATETARRELGVLLERGEAFSAVDFRRRTEVYWNRMER